MKNNDIHTPDDALCEALRRIDQEAGNLSLSADFEARLLRQAFTPQPRRLSRPWLWASVAAALVLTLCLTLLYQHSFAPTVYRDTYASVDEVYLHHCTDPKTNTITIQL